MSQAMAEDVGKAQQDRQGDAAQLQMVGQLLQVDGARRILGGVGEDVAVLGDREVALAPSIELVEFRGVVNGEDLSRLPRSSASCRGAHCRLHNTQLFSKRIRCDGKKVRLRRGAAR